MSPATTWDLKEQRERHEKEFLTAVHTCTTFSGSAPRDACLKSMSQCPHNNVLLLFLHLDKYNYLRTIKHMNPKVNQGICTEVFFFLIQRQLNK